MKAFEIALNELFISPNDHILVTGVLPTQHERALVLQKIHGQNGLMLWCDPSVSRVEHVVHTVRTEGVLHKIFAYQGTVDALYGTCVPQESVDSIVYVVQKNDEVEQSVREIARILKLKGRVAVIEKTPKHPLTGAVVASSFVHTMVQNGFSLQQIHTDDHLYTVSMVQRVSDM